MSTPTTIYNSSNSKCSNTANEYNKTAMALYRYLAYRDLPSLISKYGLRGNALDYGAGTGISTNFLLNQKFTTFGVDTSSEMLNEARSKCPFVDFRLIEKNSIPFPSASFDLVFSSFVLFEIGTKEAVIRYLKEAKRILKEKGIFIGITGSEEMYSKNWTCFETNFLMNKNLKSGSLAKVFLHEEKIEFTDFYWRLSDYEHCFEKANLEIIEKHYPLGKDEERIAWKDEKHSSPYIIIVAKPKSR